MSGLAGVILGLPWIVAVLALLMIFRSERHRREHGLPPSVPRPLFALYRILAFAIVAFLAWSMLRGIVHS